MVPAHTGRGYWVLRYVVSCVRHECVAASYTASPISCRRRRRTYLHWLGSQLSASRENRPAQDVNSVFEASFQSTLTKRAASIDGAKKVFFACSTAASNTA